VSLGFEAPSGNVTLPKTDNLVSEEREVEELTGIFGDVLVTRPRFLRRVRLVFKQTLRIGSDSTASDNLMMSESDMTITLATPIFKEDRTATTSGGTETSDDEEDDLAGEPGNGSGVVPGTGAPNCGDLFMELIVMKQKNLSRNRLRFRN
jgi:hypothetical protein